MQTRPRVERFAREAGFEIVPCAPRIPETKGKVENANRFLSRPFVYEGASTVGRASTTTPRASTAPSRVDAREVRRRELSVSRRMIGRRARLALSADGVLRVYGGGDLVSVHDMLAPGGPVVYDPARYAVVLSGKRWYADGDIEEAARCNLELLGGLGGGAV